MRASQNKGSKAAGIEYGILCACETHELASNRLATVTGKFSADRRTRASKVDLKRSMPDVIVLSDSEDDLPQLSKLSLNSSTLSHVSDSEPETGLLFSDLESPATPSTPKRLPKAKKKRRVTIITIADSDSDDAALPCDKIVSTCVSILS